MPVEIRELIIKASIEQKSEKVTGMEMNEELIEKIKNEIINEVLLEIKENINDIIYNK
jgi:hypothetical protein